MWFYPLLIVLVILAVVGGTLAGGVYTLVLIPLAVVVAVSVIVYAMWGRSMEARAGGSTEATAQKHGAPSPPAGPTQRPRSQLT